MSRAPAGSQRWERARGALFGRTENRAQPNGFGLPEALIGLAIGYGLALFAVSAYSSVSHSPSGRVTFGETIVSLAGLWVGFVGAAVVASRIRVPNLVRGTGSVRKDYGLSVHPLRDVPLGLVVGVASQFLLVPLLELPLRPFVPNLSQRLGHPTRQLLGPAATGNSAKLVLIAVLVCVGSPIVEELFFRGLVLRALLGTLRDLGPRAAPLLSIVITGLVFGLVHFEALQFLGLAGFGMVLGLLAWRTGRLGPCIFAHLAFNATTVIAYVATH